MCIMSEENCSGSCSTCSADCASRKPSKEELLEPANAFSKVRRVIGVVSGKGGVGKSFVTAGLAAAMQKKGYQTAVLDADVTGPSIPKSFGITGKASSSPQGMVPAESANGTKIMSVNLLVDKEDTPVIWRGPVIAGVVKQFWSEVFWGDVDYMFVDMPPGTGDVPLTVFQSLPLDGIVIVTSPQDLVSMIVKKAVNMAKSMEIPILGIVENYSYMVCGCCGEKLSVFGESNIDSYAEEWGLKVLAKLPIDPEMAKTVDKGKVETLEGELFQEAVDFIEKVCPKDEKKSERLISKVIACTTSDGKIACHFGKAEQLSVFHVKDGDITEVENVSVTPDGNDEMAKRVLAYNAQVLLCNGIGFPAMQELLGKQVMVVPGQKGNADELVRGFLSGTDTLHS